jgi:uncharacterized protein
VAPLPPPVVGPAAAPPGWYPDPWAMAAVRWYDGATWTGLVHGEPGPAVPEVAGLRTFPLRAGLGGFGVLLGSLFLAAVLAGILFAVGVPEWAAVLVVSVGGYLPPVLYVRWAVRRWGTGSLADDLGFRFRPLDAGWGPLTLLGCWAAQITVAVIVLSLGLPQGSNTEGLFDDDGSRAVFLAFAVSAVLAAPLVEELLFRGLLLRSLLARLGTPLAVFVQAAMFGVVHLSPTLGLGNVSLVLALTAVGAVLGAVAIWTRRLAAPIIAHALLNGVALTIVWFTG